MNYTHKKTNKSTNMKARVLPPGSLGSYLRRPTPIASGDGRERSYFGKASSCLCAPAWIAESQGAAGKRGAATLQPTTAGSNSPSSFRWLGWKSFDVIWCNGGRDHWHLQKRINNSYYQSASIYLLLFLLKYIVFSLTFHCAEFVYPVLNPNAIPYFNIYKSASTI